MLRVSSLLSAPTSHCFSFQISFTILSRCARFQREFGDDSEDAAEEAYFDQCVAQHSAALAAVVPDHLRRLHREGGGPTAFACSLGAKSWGRSHFTSFSPRKTTLRRTSATRWTYRTWSSPASSGRPVAARLPESHLGSCSTRPTIPSSLPSHPPHIPSTLTTLTVSVDGLESTVQQLAPPSAFLRGLTALKQLDLSIGIGMPPLTVLPHRSTTHSCSHSPRRSWTSRSADAQHTGTLTWPHRLLTSGRYPLDAEAVYQGGGSRAEPFGGLANGLPEQAALPVSSRQGRPGGAYWDEETRHVPLRPARSSPALRVRIGVEDGAETGARRAKSGRRTRGIAFA